MSASGETTLADVLAVCAERLGPDATAVLSRLGGKLATEAAAAHRDLVGRSEAARTQRRSEVLARARVPAVGPTHPSWLDVTLASLPARARTAIVSSATANLDGVDLWLARWATSALPVPLPPLAPFAASLATMDTTRLRAWLVDIALDQLAFALGPAAARDTRLAPAAARIATSPRVGQLGSQRASLRRCRGAQLDDVSALVAIAGRALAPHLASHPMTTLVLTRRLPHPLGSVLERELVANASVPMADVPAWAAVAP